MKKLFLYIIFAASLLSGCNDLESEGLSRITYFPEFELQGEELYFIGEGDDFTDPGVKAFEAGEEIPVASSYYGRYSFFSGSSIGTAPDQYNLNYTAVNKDGFAVNESRRIIAINTGDMTTSLEGAYEATPVRINGVSYATHPIVLIWETAPNVYEISCSVAGFYADGRGDGDGSLSRGGTITVNDLATNDFAFTPGFIDNFGSEVGITSMTVNATTKTITFVTEGDFANGLWNVTMTQIQP
jgi:hypothetical protein